MTDALVTLFNGKAAELDIHDPNWLYAGRLTDLADGTSWRFVYRSGWLHAGDAVYQRALDYLDGALPVGAAEMTADPMMMFGSAELTLWQ